DGEASWTAVCQVRRKGERSWLVRSFDTADAIRARVWGKAGPWSEYPKRMLQMRARAFALRDGFPDVLGGLYLREEVEGSGFATRAPAPAHLFGAGPGGAGREGFEASGAASPGSA
ncbi:recombinase family protein, partial [Alsobacter sp. SYSU BS001988]